MNKRRWGIQLIQYDEVPALYRIKVVEFQIPVHSVTSNAFLSTENEQLRGVTAKK